MVVICDYPAATKGTSETPAYPTNHMRRVANKMDICLVG